MDWGNIEQKYSHDYSGDIKPNIAKGQRHKIYQKGRKTTEGFYKGHFTNYIKLVFIVYILESQNY